MGRHAYHAGRRVPGERQRSPKTAGKVSGTFGSQMGEAPVAGTIEGHAFKLTMTAQTPQGAMEVQS